MRFMFRRKFFFQLAVVFASNFAMRKKHRDTNELLDFRGSQLLSSRDFNNRVEHFVTSVLPFWSTFTVHREKCLWLH